MNEDFAVDGEGEPNTERLLESDHVLVQIHLERRAVRHRRNPETTGIETASEVVSSDGSANNSAAPKRRRTRRRISVESESSATGDLQSGHSARVSG